MQLPSASNTAGTAAGTVAGGLTLAYLSSAPFMVPVAAFLSITPAGAAAAAGVLVTAIVNYGVTHFSELKGLNDLVKTWWPQVQASYPGDGKQDPQVKSNINNG